MGDPAYLTTKLAADFLTSEVGLPVAATTLGKLACVGGGPPYRRYANKRIYTRPELREWAEGRLSAPRKSSSQGG
jgi:hypothetical protein